MEANQNITMEPYNIEYYIAKYGTVENLTNDYIGAIDGLRMQYKQYEDNPRKGGRYRREKMEHIRRQAEAIYDELLRVSRAMKDYFAAQAAEAPRISKETAETVNVSAEGEKEAQRAENAPKRKIQYFHYTPEQLKRYIIDVYEKNANGEWVLQPYRQINTDFYGDTYEVVDGKIRYWTNRSRGLFFDLNMDFNSETCGTCHQIRETYQTGNYVISNEKLLEFTMANGAYRCIQKQVYSKDGERKEFFTIMDAHGDFAVNDASDTLEGIMQRFDKRYKGTATIIWQAPTASPQSPEAPQIVECIADTSKPRETARKRPNRGIGRASATRRDTLRDTLRPVTYVPRECSTADYW